MQGNRYKIHGISPEGSEKYWSGTGWVAHTSKTFTFCDSETIERNINIKDGNWCAMKEAA